jgi:hypothetical protein
MRNLTTARTVIEAATLLLLAEADLDLDAG